MAYFRFFLLGAAVVLLMPGDVTAQLCSLCECPALYAPVCGYRPIGREYRTFSSLCVLNCANKCEKYKYRFVVDGRCRAYLATSTTTTTTTTTTSTTAAPEYFVVPSEQPTTMKPLIVEDTEIPEVVATDPPQDDVPLTQEAEQEEQVQQQKREDGEMESLASLWARVATI